MELRLPTPVLGRYGDVADGCCSKLAEWQAGFRDDTERSRMVLFCDTSVLLKLYIIEAGNEVCGSGWPRPVRWLYAA